MKLLWQLVPWTLVVVVLALSCADRSDLTNRVKSSKAETEKYQALYAEAATKVVRLTDTVRVRIDGVKVVRDTLLQHITDTVLVRQYIAATDTALKACSELAETCSDFRTRATSLIGSQKIELDLTRRLNVDLQRKVQRANAVTITALIIGGLIGAYVRGQ